MFFEDLNKGGFYKKLPFFIPNIQVKVWYNPIHQISLYYCYKSIDFVLVKILLTLLLVLN